MVDPNATLAVLEELSYGGIFLVTFLSGYAIPVPEEIILLAVGYLGGVGIIQVGQAILVSLLAVFGSDCVLFYLARHHNRYTERLKARLEQSWLAKSWFCSREHIGRTIFFLRFVIGLRFVGPVLAGSLRTRWLTFVLADLLAILIQIPFFILLGFHFHASFVKLVTGVEVTRHVIFIVALVVVGLLIARFVHRKLGRPAPLS